MQSAFTVFFGSFLAFLVQPMLGRVLLPIFGGSATVWGVCLVVYQLLLLLGYFFAYRLPVAMTASFKRYIGLLFGSALWMVLGAVAISNDWLAFSGTTSHPWLSAPLCALLLIGLPYTLLCAGGILLQAVVAAVETKRNPYRLYAISNAGSLAALVIYPLAIEPFVPVTVQWGVFAALVAVYASCFLALSRRLPASSATPVAAPSIAGAANSAWWCLPALFAFALNAAVAHLFTDVVPMPFVWNIVLAAFLAGWIAGFSRLGGLFPRLWSVAALFSVLFAAGVLSQRGAGSFTVNLVSVLLLMVLGGCVITRRLYEIRPSEPASLPRYYLYTAFGGAVVGFCVSFVAPVIFPAIWEYPLVLTVSAAFFACRAFSPRAPRRILTVSLCLAAVAVTTVVLSVFSRPSQARVVFRERGFYGCLRVTRKIETIGQSSASVSYLWCGQTTHGLQVRGSTHPFSYYMPESGGVALRAHPSYRDDGKPMKVGIVGLGVGALSSYGRPGDIYRFYEINPQIIKLAVNKALFTFVSSAMCAIDVVEGDARKMMERESAEKNPRYDVLILDAYSGDAIPYHLITKEAVELYLDRLNDDGILAMHVSNWHIDMLPICKALAQSAGLYLYGIATVGEAPLIADAIWVFMTRHPVQYPDDALNKVKVIDWNAVKEYPVLTDDCGSLLPLMRR